MSFKSIRSLSYDDNGDGDDEEQLWSNHYIASKQLKDTLFILIT